MSIHIWCGWCDSRRQFRQAISWMGEMLINTTKRDFSKCFEKSRNSCVFREVQIVAIGFLMERKQSGYVSAEVMLFSTEINSSLSPAHIRHTFRLQLSERCSNCAKPVVLTRLFLTDKGHRWKSLLKQLQTALRPETNYIAALVISFRQANYSHILPKNSKFSAFTYKFIRILRSHIP